MKNVPHIPVPKIQLARDQLWIKCDPFGLIIVNILNQSKVQMIDWGIERGMRQNNYRKNSTFDLETCLLLFSKQIDALNVERNKLNWKELNFFDKSQTKNKLTIRLGWSQRSFCFGNLFVTNSPSKVTQLAWNETKTLEKLNFPTDSNKTN